MRAWIALVALGFALVIATVNGGAQLTPGDIIVTGVDTAKAGGLTLRLDPTTGAVTTLLAKLPAPRQAWAGNWVEMGPNNRDVWVAYEDGAQKGAVYVLDAFGKVTSIRPVPWRTDCFRLHPRGWITWSGLGPLLTDRLVLTDLNLANPWALVSGLPLASLCHREIAESGLIAVSFQAVSPKGGIAVVDSSTTKVVKTIAGLGMVNTLDYDLTSGMVHAVEFGSPKNPTAHTGGLFAVDLGAGKVTSLIDSSGPAGLLVDRLNWVHRRTDGTLLLGARHLVFRYDLASRRIVKTWAVAPDRTFAVTGGTVYARRMVRLDASKGTHPGYTVDVHVCFPHAKAPGSSYRLACSMGVRPGIVIGNSRLDLMPDAVFFLSVMGWVPGIFRNFSGLLDAKGEARAEFALPNDPNLKGLRFHIGGIGLFAGGAIHVTNVESLTVGQ